MLDLDFKLHPSKQYLIFMSTTLLISLVIMLCLPFSWWVKLLGCAAICVYGGNILWQHGFLRSQRSITAIRCVADGSWLLFTKQQVYRAEVRGDSTVTGVVSVLRFRIEAERFPRSCIVLRDSLMPEQYRQLVVLLRMG